MSVNNKTAIDCLRQLEALLQQDKLFEEAEIHPLTVLSNQLHKIDDESDSANTDENQKLVSRLVLFEINIFRHFMKQISPRISATVLTALFDSILNQIYLHMMVTPISCDSYFDLSLNYLTADSTIDYLKAKDAPESSIDEHMLTLFASVGSRSVYTKRSLSYSLFVSRKTAPTLLQFNEPTEKLLEALIVYLDDYYLPDCQPRPSHPSILKWLLNLTDIYGYVPYFLRTGYPAAILRWLSIQQSQAKTITLKVWSWIIGILHNLARHRAGVEMMNRLGTINVLKTWKDNCFSTTSTDSDVDFKDVLIAYHLLYATLLEPTELKKEKIANVQIALNYILEQTIEAFNAENLSSGPYNVCEYLDGLSKLVVNDTFLIYIVSRDNVYELFLEKFLHFNTHCDASVLNTMICASLYTIFWSISFLPDYSVRLKSNESFLSFVQQKANKQSSEEHDVAIRQAAIGILFNLDCAQTDSLATEANRSDDDNKIKVMVSYSHKDMKFCNKLVSGIHERFHGDVWVDFNRLVPPYEDDWAEIAHAITQCDVILMVVTENYCSSKSCRREVIHADKRNKTMIPIYVGRDYTADDWFEIRAGSATYIRFEDKKSDEEVFEKLIDLINAQEKRVKPHVERVTVSNENHPKKEILFNASEIHGDQSTEGVSAVNVNTAAVRVPHQDSKLPALPAGPVEEWTREQVQQFLQLPPSSLQLSSGRALVTYVRLLSRADDQYDEYERHLRDRGVSREQFANLMGRFATVRSASGAETTPAERTDCRMGDEIERWFEGNGLSKDLLNALHFENKSQLTAYAKLIVESPSRIDEEYNRLRDQIGVGVFHTGEFARLISGLQTLVAESKSKEPTAVCTVL